MKTVWLETCFLLLCCIWIASSVDNRYQTFITNNLDRSCKTRESVMPLSYFVPDGYYASIPPSDRISPNSTAAARNIPECGGFVSKAKMQDYEFQTEEIVTKYGLNIYDGAIWMIANGILGSHELGNKYMANILNAHKTCEWQGIDGDSPCKGLIVTGTCESDCGLCYGDGAGQSLRKPFAWYFKTLSETYDFKSYPDARCPEKGISWKWNNWIPVLGENSWARLIGPLQASYLKYGSIQAMPLSDLYMSLDYIKSLKQMLIPSIGAIYYAPHNTYGVIKQSGETISTENQASTLAGLLMLKHILQEKNAYPLVVDDINMLSTNIERFLKEAYDPSLGYIRQGGYYRVESDSFLWDSIFAVDCQTWTMTIIGSEKMDAWFGSGTALKIWDYTKSIAGYKFDGSFAHGLGFDSNQNKPVQNQIFSGEWTFGAINLLKLFLNENNGYNPDPLQIEINFMRDAINKELTTTVQINGVNAEGIKYANKRYWIPFGWWSNPIPSLASTGWATIIDNNFNPLYLGGKYQTYQFDN
eukprot:TRINITY_DN2964_c0_g1_i1.p1 TRINITY_DN2964_c0_g1~~TRINITY_DN2964_c0_g1_i1.p1  ORF type:complete len:529 (+),score=83.81 TRINITY_DN2964_c0_g1_i1:3-1589(+)